MIEVGAAKQWLNGKSMPLPLLRLNDPRSANVCLQLMRLAGDDADPPVQSSFLDFCATILGHEDPACLLPLKVYIELRRISNVGSRASNLWDVCLCSGKLLKVPRE